MSPCGNTEDKGTSDGGNEVSIRSITLSIEFLTTALRAVADGHPISSHMVREPLLWGFSSVSGMAKHYMKSGA